MSKRYKLLTTAIVTALDASNPTARGVVWNPVEVNDVQEAEALAQVGIAQETSDKATVETVAARRAKPADAVADQDDDDDDETEVEVSFAELLEGTVDDVAAALADMDVEQLAGLAEAERAGKNRKGVLDAIEAYLE